MKLGSTALVVVGVGIGVKALKPYLPMVISRWLPF